MRSIVWFSLIVVCLMSFIMAYHRRTAREECEQDMPTATKEECRMLSEYAGDTRLDILACSTERGYSITSCYMLVKYGRAE